MADEPRHLDLVDRLRGQYHLPVNDGAGPLNGSMTFSREYPTAPIQKEAADLIERMRQILTDALPALEYDWERRPVGPKKSAALALWKAANTAAETPYDHPHSDDRMGEPASDAGA